ncbi:hypothetical protein Hdeb2414_s0020g00553891 [Helianthus debilis subsp. tardiflorus]
MNSDPNYVLYFQSMIILNFLIEENKSGYCATVIVSGKEAAWVLVFEKYVIDGIKRSMREVAIQSSFVHL